MVDFPKPWLAAIGRFIGQHIRFRKRRSPLMVLLLVGALSVTLGLGWANATEPPGISTGEPMSERSALGRQFYIESCGGCHIAVPPQVLPTQTWQSLIQDSRHYGVEITPLLNPTLPVVWSYLQEFSRTYAEGQRIPFLIDNSRY
ncbi:MAG TPA: hypothetical protein V6C88_15500, partial [Chroococcidiopsis sp.]